MKTLLLSALEQHLGNVSGACEAIKINRLTFYNWIKKDSEFAQKVEELENVSLDFAESKLKENISKNDTTAIIFYLKTKGQKRGYIEKVHNINENKEPLKIEVTTPDQKKTIEEL